MSTVWIGVLNLYSCNCCTVRTPVHGRMFLLTWAYMDPEIIVGDPYLSIPASRNLESSSEEEAFQSP